MLIDPTPRNPRGFCSLQAVVCKLRLLPREQLEELVKITLDDLLTLEAGWAIKPSRTIEKRLSAAEDDDERLVILIWTLLWLGRIVAWALHPVTGSLHRLEPSAWDPFLDSVRDLTKSIANGVYLGPAQGPGSLDRELLGSSLLMANSDGHYLLEVRPASKADRKAFALAMISAHQKQSDQPMLKANFVQAMRRQFEERISQDQAEGDWASYTPKAWRKGGRRPKKSPPK